MNERSGIELCLRVARADFALDVALHLPGQGITALFGPSGCGKTTLLRALAGLERGRGRVVVHGQLWQDDASGHWLPPHQRQIGYVFQEASLFPHLNVQHNMEYGLHRLPPARRRVSLQQAVELLGLEGLLQRMPHNLSGGERQRVAIARALAASPALLLMDEPLAALDAARKAELLPYLERLQRELALALLYVSHASDEVARLSHHLVLLEQGRVRAQGATSTLLARLDLPLAHESHAGALVQAQVVAHDAHDHLLSADFAGGTLHLVSPRSHRVGESVRLRILARDVSLARSAARDSSILNLLPVRVSALQSDSPGQTLVVLDAQGTPLLARLSTRSCRLLGLAAGQAVFAQIKAVALVD